MGKSISSKVTAGAHKFIIGKTEKRGATVLSPESGVGPDFNHLGKENTPSHGVTSGHLREHTELKHDETAEPLESGNPTNALSKNHLLGTKVRSGPLTVIVAEFDASTSDEASLAGDVKPCIKSSKKA